MWLRDHTQGYYHSVLVSVSNPDAEALQGYTIAADSAVEMNTVQQPLSVAGLRWQCKTPDNLSSFWCDSTCFLMFTRSPGITTIILQTHWYRTASRVVYNTNNMPNVFMANNLGNTTYEYTRLKSVIQLKLEIISGTTTTNLQRCLILWNASISLGFNGNIHCIKSHRRLNQCWISSQKLNKAATKMD